MGGKLAIASKVDYFKGEFIGDQLNADIARRVEEIMKKYPDPPKREERPRQDYRPKGQYRGPPRRGGPQPRWEGKRPRR
jgi:nucleolar protein 56